MECDADVESKTAGNWRLPKSHHNTEVAISIPSSLLFINLRDACIPEFHNPQSKNSQSCTKTPCTNPNGAIPGYRKQAHKKGKRSKRPARFILARTQVALPHPPSVNSVCAQEIIACNIVSSSSIVKCEREEMVGRDSQSRSVNPVPQLLG